MLLEVICCLVQCSDSSIFKMEIPLECQSESDFEAGKNTVMLLPDKLKSQSKQWIILMKVLINVNSDEGGDEGGCEDGDECED